MFGLNVSVANQSTDGVSGNNPKSSAILEEVTLHYSGGTLDAEQKLEAVKRALVDIALGSEVELSSAAYLDDAGVLHESSVMTSNAKIRGIRVLSYVKAAAGITEAQIDAKVLSDQKCPGSRPSLVREAVVQVTQNYKNHRELGVKQWNEAEL